MDFVKKPAVHVLLIVFLGILAYSGTFHVPFVFDDAYSITDNPLIKDIGRFMSPEGYVAYPNRYLGFLTFALNYRFCGLDVKGYHIVNLSIHLINALLVYLLVVLTFKTDKLKDSSIADSAGLIAFFASVLFAVHPVETQAVTYIVQRLTSLAVGLYLAALIFFIKARFSIGRERAARRAVVIFYMLSLLLAILAMKTKEIAFTLPLIALLYEFFFFEWRIRKRLLFLLPMLITLLIIPVSLLLAHKSTGNLLSDVGKVTTAGSLPRWDYLLTQFSVIVTYCRLLILPINQNLDYDYPISHSFFVPRVLGSLLILSCLLGIAVYLLRRSRKGGDAALRLISFGILWFFITLSVESSVIPIEDVIFEHRVYLPSIGMFMAAACVGAMAAKRWFAGRRIPLYAATSVVLIFLAATCARNNVWTSQISLWQDTVKKSPNKARPHNALGAAYFTEGWLETKDTGWLDRAIDEYRVALELKPDYADAHTNLGAAYSARGWLDGAINEDRLALKIKPDSMETHFNLGRAYSAKGWMGRAIDEYRVALKLKPDSAYAHYYLGTSFAAKGMRDKAIEEYRVAIKLKPDFADAHLDLGHALMEGGVKEEAVKELELGNAYARAGMAGNFRK
jgi:protein O-mannosyl-transferase